MTQSQGNANASPTESDSARRQAIYQHVQQHIGPIAAILRDEPADGMQIDLIIVAPQASRNCWTVITCGMSEQEMTVPDAMKGQMAPRAELMMALPPDWPVGDEEWNDQNNVWPAMLLKMLARMPHRSNGFVGPGSTAPNGQPPRPFAGNTRMSGAMLMPVSLAPESFGKVQIDGAPLHFLAVLPIYLEELTLVMKQGPRALVSRFLAATQTEMLNVARRSYASPLISTLPDDEQAPKRMIDAVRQKLGPTPRSFGLFGRGYLRIDRPDWCGPEFGGFSVYQRSSELLKTGRVVWGAIAWANDKALKPGEVDQPGVVVLGADASYDKDALALGDITNVLNAAQQQAGGHVLEKLGGEGVKTVAEEIVGKRTAYTAPVVFHRKHLPHGYVTGQILPVLMFPAGTGPAMVVPAKYWPDELLALWAERS